MSSEEACNWSIGHRVWLWPFNRITVGVELLAKRQVTDEIPETRIRIALKSITFVRLGFKNSKVRCIVTDYLYN